MEMGLIKSREDDLLTMNLKRSIIHSKHNALTCSC